MNSTTIDHDCYLENNITLSSNVVLGGNVYIMKYANLGIKTIVHQNQVIGSYSMIGMGSLITRNKKIIPGYVYYGKPIKKIKKNKFSLIKTKLVLKNSNLNLKDLKNFKENMKEIAILLPYKENFTENNAGAASIWVKDYLNKSKLKKKL